MKEKQKNITEILDKKRLYCIIGPSGSGKTTYVAYAKKAMGFSEIVSTTTRKPRKKESNGIDYYFVSEKEFNDTDFLECDRYAEHSYGTSTDAVVRAYSHHENAAFAVVTYEGSQKLKNAFRERNISLDVITVFVSTPPHLLESRMRKRGDGEELIRQRLENILKTSEYSNASETDWVFSCTEEMSALECCRKFTELIREIETSYLQHDTEKNRSSSRDDPFDKIL